MQRDPLFCDPLVSESSGRGRAAGHNLVPPLHMVPHFLVEGGSEVISSSYFPLAVCTLRRQSAFKISAIWRLRCWRSPWLRVGYWRINNFVLTSLHVSTNIHGFFFYPYALGLGIVLRRYTKSQSFFVTVVGLQRG